MITAREIDEYRECDLHECREPARWEFTVTDKGGRARRVYVCQRHQIEGFARARDLS